MAGLRRPWHQGEARPWHWWTRGPWHRGEARPRHGPAHDTGPVRTL